METPTQTPIPKFTCALCPNTGNLGFTATHYGMLCPTCMHEYHRWQDHTPRWHDDD